MTAPGTNPYSRDAGPVDENTMRIVMAGGSAIFGDPTDLPAATPTDATAESIIALLKAIANKNFNIDATNATLVLQTDDLENFTRPCNPEIKPAQLIAPGNGAAIDTLLGNLHKFVVTIASIDTNVVLRFESSNDGVIYSNMDAANAEFTFTANGSFTFSRADLPAKFVRVVFVSELGGTAATIDTSYV